MTRWLPIPPPVAWKHDPARLKAFLVERQLSGAQAAALLDVDARTIRRWTGGERSMPYAAWYCLVHRASTPSSGAG